MTWGGGAHGGQLVCEPQTGSFARGVHVLMNARFYSADNVSLRVSIQNIGNSDHQEGSGNGGGYRGRAGWVRSWCAGRSRCSPLPRSP
jgi:hypothetical protein